MVFLTIWSNIAFFKTKTKCELQNYRLLAFETALRPSNARITALIEICSKDKSAKNVKSTNRLVKKREKVWRTKKQTKLKLTEGTAELEDSEAQHGFQACYSVFLGFSIPPAKWHMDHMIESKRKFKFQDFFLFILGLVAQYTEPRRRLKWKFKRNPY